MTDQITYEEGNLLGFGLGTLVFLKGRRVGYISRTFDDFFTYYPRGKKDHAALFDTLAECKQSLEGTDND